MKSSRTLCKAIMSECQYFPLTSSSKVISSHCRSPSSRSWQFSMVIGGSCNTSLSFSSAISTPFFQSSTSSSVRSISHHGSSGLPIVTLTITGHNTARNESEATSGRKIENHVKKQYWQPLHTL